MIVMIPAVQAYEVPTKTSPADNLALNADTSASDSGWGGGSSKSDLTDGLRTYDGEWARGLAFPYGQWHQVIIDFGHQVTFDRVIQWYHGGMNNNEASAYKLQYWNGLNWVDIFETDNSHAYLKYPGALVEDWWYYWSTPYENTFTPVTSDKLRILNFPLDGSHTWLYEVEVYGSTTVPTPPSLKSPINGSELNNTIPRLEWNPSNDATSYGLQVSTDSNFATKVVDISGIIDTYYDIPAGKLNWNTFYYWRVNAANANGTSDWSEQWQFTPTSVRGVDVSHWQGDIDWIKVNNAGYEFAFVKATQGINWYDKKFYNNMKNGKAANMLMGAYHFATPDLKKNDAKAEADYFIKISDDYLKAGYLRPALDVEAKNSCNNNKNNKVTLSEWVNEWMNTVKNETGVEPILYTYKWYANNCFDSSVTNRDLWIANYGVTYPDTGIWNNWVFWQFSETGSVPGIQGDVDLNKFNGDEFELNNFVIK